MRPIALVICFFTAAFGALGLILPSRLIGVVRYFQTPIGFYFAAGIRVLLGVALLFAAEASRATSLISVVGIIVIIAGVVMPLIGIERFRRLLDSWSEMGTAFIRGWAALALLFGLLLIYALVP